MEINYVLDASAIINGFEINNYNNFTVSEITEEIKDFKSKLAFDLAIGEGKISICDVEKKYFDQLEEIISSSGDILRLSSADKKLIALAIQLQSNGQNVKVISDDYTIQNTLKILNISFSSVVCEGIKEIYNWKKVCEGCKKEFSENYPFDDCEICGSKIFKKRIKVDK